MPDEKPQPRAAPAIAVIVSRYNGSITARLLEGAEQEYAARGGDGPAVFEAPGAYELPALALAAAQTGRYRGVVALGCLIRGETRHDRYIAEAVSAGLMQVSLQTGVPVAFGVLTVDTAKQARARAGGRANKGREAMAAVLDTVAALEAVRDGVKRPVLEPAPDKARGQRRGAAGRPAGRAAGKVS